MPNRGRSRRLKWTGSDLVPETNKIGWLAGLVVAGCLGILTWQRQTAGRLREEQATQRQDLNEQAALLAKNRILQATAPSAEELDRLRADHDAIARLRGEVVAVKNRPPPVRSEREGGEAKAKAEPT